MYLEPSFWLLPIVKEVLCHSCLTEPKTRLCLRNQIRYVLKGTMHL